jgi:hypothetical protein
MIGEATASVSARQAVSMRSSIAVYFDLIPMILGIPASTTLPGS